VARGNASKFFHPFILPGDLKGSSEEVKNKLLVNFDPLRCFVGDLEASIFNAMTIIFEEWIFLFTFSLDICIKSSPTCSRYGMILWEVMLLA
jgi:hypothetical protein